MHMNFLNCRNKVVILHWGWVFVKSSSNPAPSMRETMLRNWSRSYPPIEKCIVKKRTFQIHAMALLQRKAYHCLAEG